MSEECFSKKHDCGNEILDNLKKESHIEQENLMPIDIADTASYSKNVDDKDCNEKPKKFCNIRDIPIMQPNTVITFSDNEKDNDKSVGGQNIEQWTVEKKLLNFLQWCKANNLNLSSKVKVDFNGTSHRYGMLATEDIKKGEVLFTVPRQLLLNQNTATLKNRLNEFEKWLDTHGKSLNDSSGWLPLLITLMWEFNQKDSFWASYLLLVPEISEFGHPLFWKEEEYNLEFQGMPLLNDIIVDRENIETEYAEFVLLFLRRNKDLFGSLENYSLEFFKRMVAFVMAYSFTEDEESPSMVPMADILNHHSNNNAHLVFHKSNLQMISIRRIKKGEEVFNTFGKLGNTELLQMYGYVEIPSNQYDSLLLPVKDFYKIMTSKNGTANDDPYLLAKINLLNRTGIAEVDAFFMFDKNGLRCGPDLIQFLKIFHASDRELEKILKTRASKRPESFYHKLLRKLRLSKKTEKNSLGMTVIDITEDDTEMDIENFNKRKNVDENELDENAFSSKRPLLSNSLLSCQYSSSKKCSVIELDVGSSTSNTIEIIDESDEDNDINNKAGECCNYKNENDSDLQINLKSELLSSGASSNSDQNKLLRTCEDITANQMNDAADNIKCGKKVELFSCDEGNKQISLTHFDADSNYKEDSNHKEDSEIFIMSSIDTKNINTSVTNVHPISENMLDNGCSENRNINQISMDLNSSSSSITLFTSLPESNIAKDVSDNGLLSHMQTVFDVDSSAEESGEDIEFVEESFPFSLSYEKLKELMKPEWKETILFVLDVLDKNMKNDENITQPNDLPRNLRNAFYVRQGQRIIINLFKSHMV
uniref:N-lysine methyltransferase SETD6 n=1 Tax=Hydra vulgaris TaxID=6087 RepID=T2M9D8_HYDVU